MDSNPFLNTLRSLGLLAAGNVAPKGTLEGGPITGSQPTRQIPSKHREDFDIYAETVDDGAEGGRTYDSISEERLDLANLIGQGVKQAHSPNAPTANIYYIDNETGTPMFTVIGENDGQAWQMTYEWQSDNADQGAHWVKADDDEVTDGTNLLRQMRRRARGNTIYDLDGFPYTSNELHHRRNGDYLENGLLEITDQGRLPLSENNLTQDQREYLGNEVDYDFYNMMRQYGGTGGAQQRTTRNNNVQRNFFDFENKARTSGGPWFFTRRIGANKKGGLGKSYGTRTAPYKNIL